MYNEYMTNLTAKSYRNKTIQIFFSIQVTVCNHALENADRASGNETNHCALSIKLTIGRLYIWLKIFQPAPMTAVSELLPSQLLLLHGNVWCLNSSIAKNQLNHSGHTPSTPGIYVSADPYSLCLLLYLIENLKSNNIFEKIWNKWRLVSFFKQFIFELQVNQVRLWCNFMSL